MIEQHEQNTSGRDFFVGDIHGQYNLLMNALARDGFDNSRDRLFSVGDLIDRGPESFECLKLAFEPWFYGVRGNHEMMAHDALNGTGSLEHWFINGGDWIRGHDPIEVRQILNEAMRYLPYAREIQIGDKRVGMVHAEPPPDWWHVCKESVFAAYDQVAPETIDIIDRDKLLQSLVWGRTRISQGDGTPVVGIDAVVVGHTILERPVTLGNVHYIDTGAFHTGNLTLFDARELFE